MNYKKIMLCVIAACGMHEMQAMQGNNKNIIFHTSPVYDRQPVYYIPVASQQGIKYYAAQPHSQSILHATCRVVQASSTQGNAQQQVQELEKTVKELTAKIAILEEEKMKILDREKRIDSLMTNTILLKPNGECEYSREELRECVYL